MENFGMKVVLAVLFIVIVIVLFIVGAWAVSLLLWWVVPDVFSGAVDKGILPATITLVQAFKMSLLLGILGLTSAANSSSKK